MNVYNDVVYYDYEGIVFEFEEKVCLVNDLGKKNLMILCNYGILLVGDYLFFVYVCIYLLECVCKI